MLKTLMMTTAAGAILATAALAQAPDTSSPSSSSPPAASPGGTTSGQGGAMGSGSFVATQKPDQWLASKFRGTDVVGSDNQKIGDVSDILFTKDGKIEAFVVSVGGFLGMGAKDVALPPSAFQVATDTGGATTGAGGGAATSGAGSRDPNDIKLKISMTKDELKNAQAFEAYKAPSATGTTGGGGNTSRPGGGAGGTGGGGMGR